MIQKQLNTNILKTLIQINKNKNIDTELHNEKIEKNQLKNKIVVSKNSNQTEKLKETELQQTEQIQE